jgi:uroporphyrin-III C-methyltransferase/precorrin-2 dehydrogenase/sirohydrochlorin ferrochelatase
LPALPLFMAVAGRPVILLGAGPAAEAKRRLLDRAGARIVGEEAQAALAIVAIEDDAEAAAAVARLKARGVLVNATDRPVLCDFTLPAIVERAPVIVAVGTGGASAGLAAALRQRLETLLPATLGALATRLFAARSAIRVRYPDSDARRRALGAALAERGVLDPLTADPEAVDRWLEDGGAEAAALVAIRLRSPDPDDLTLREARLIGRADRIFHRPGIPPAILARARADAERHACPAPPADRGPGLSVDLEIAP